MSIPLSRGGGVFVGVTLNIIEHELKELWPICRNLEDNPSFGDARIYHDEESLSSKNVLYICDDADSCEEVSKAGHVAVLVCHESEASTEGAPCGLCVYGCPGKLAALNALLDIFAKYRFWEAELNACCFEDKGLQGLLDASTPFLKNHVVILDAALKLLAYSKDVPCDDEITMELIAHGYHTDVNITKFKLHRRFKPWSEESGFVVNDSYEICKYITVAYSFKTDNSFSMILVMMCNVEDPLPYLLDVFSMFIKYVEYYAKRDYPANKPAGSAVDTFLKDLCSGALRDRSEIAERCEYVNLPYDARFCLFYIEAKADSGPFLRVLSDVTLAVAPAKVVAMDDALVILCFNCLHEKCHLHCEARHCVKGVKSTSSRLNALMKSYDLYCGRSSKFTNLGDAGVAFMQAKAAYDIAIRDTKDLSNGLSQWNRIASFDSCYIDFLNDNLPRKKRDMVLMTYAGNILEAIAESDSSARTDNYDFLYTFLECERKTSVTANVLHMHRNNVRYRIDRIEQQFGIDTNDPVLRFDLMLAYHLRKLHAGYAEKPDD